MLRIATPQMMAKISAYSLARAERQEGRAVDHRAHRRDRRRQDVVDHDRGDGDEGDGGAEDEIRERVDAAAADVVALEDLRDLDHTAGQEAHQQRGEGDEEDRALADETMRLGRRVEDRRQLVHQSDDAGRQPGHVPAAALGVAEQPRLPQEVNEDEGDGRVEKKQSEKGQIAPRRRIRTSNSPRRRSGSPALIQVQGLPVRVIATLAPVAAKISIRLAP